MADRMSFGPEMYRKEDPALLTGAARFVADLEVAGCLHAHFLRSTSAHARLSRLDVSGAEAAPGVVGVFTARDLALGGLEEGTPPAGGPRSELARPCLAEDRVRFVGEAIAVVVAESAAAALDAAELIEVDLDELAVVVDPWKALEAQAPLLFPDFGSNLVLDATAGEDPTGEEAPATEAQVMAGADVVVRARMYNQRVAPAPLEPNGAVAVPSGDGSLVLWVSSQAPFGVKREVCRLLGLAPEKLRVVTPAVGGGFGAKGGTYPEQVILAALALRLGRPLRWVETRSENMLAMTHGRGQAQELELGARSDGTLVGVAARTVTELGAYPWRGGIPWRTARLMGAGVYRTPRLQLRSSAVVTNTSPVGPYRGAGRPEAAAMWERGMDMLAGELGMDPAALRRKNLLAAEDFPHLTPTGACYDSGDYWRALERALSLAEYDLLRQEQADRRRRGDLRALGIGLACFVEVSGTGPEFGSVSVETDGTVTVMTGSSPHGQGHETTLAQIAAFRLGIDPESVRVVHSDTAVVPRGIGTFGSRSGQLGGSAVAISADQVLEAAKQLAASLLEAAPGDIVQRSDGELSVAGVPSRSLSWTELAKAAADPKWRLDGGEEWLSAQADFEQEEGTYPFGAHVAVAEVDTETGRVTLRRLVAVDDCGVVVNPMIVEGQVHGGLAQGVAQALFEAVRYDDAGNPLATTLAEYSFPSAADLPAWTVDSTVTPSPRNPLGMKGVGEAGTVGSTVAVQNAVLDALAPLGVRHIDPPLSPFAIWQAIRTAAGQRP